MFFLNLAWVSHPPKKSDFSSIVFGNAKTYYKFNGRSELRFLLIFWDV